MRIVGERRFKSVAFPIIGAGSGAFDTDAALSIMLRVFTGIEADAKVILVRYGKGHDNNDYEDNQRQRPR